MPVPHSVIGFEVKMYESEINYRNSCRARSCRGGHFWVRKIVYYTKWHKSQPQERHRDPGLENISEWTIWV